ncbi:pentatricopeptide repeat-containing protein At2g27610-like [Primulina tabacum]|uniref:pentatricopeptide repeat-containing protein At2g27610-like n=1 Tax=Primulina tabacum TaxID=48773 RepID=UPI003F5996EF
MHVLCPEQLHDKGNSFIQAQRKFCCNNAVIVSGALGESEKLLDDRQVKKETGLSWIEVKNKTYAFMAGDVSHPLSDVIYMKLEELSIRLRDAGFQPDTNYVLHDIERNKKKAILSQHSEKLAVASHSASLPVVQTSKVLCQ